MAGPAEAKKREAGKRGVPSAAGSGASLGEIPPEFRSDILELLEIVGGEQTQKQIAAVWTTEFFASLRQAEPNLPPDAWKILEEVTRKFVDEAVEQGVWKETLVRSYAKYFTHEEIRGLLAFYRSPLGQKTISVAPALMAEGHRAGRDWMQQSLPRFRAEILRRLAEEGLLTPLSGP